ncbi:general stress protein [Mesorhizobium sp. M00.F.Ca.ET.216.01.1.1]|uniref:general stress protein n=1 Tax=Mesorhizobium sp. M00.F.Ca.ET.216.01.1.1 TaxID=2500528 RepID=UPI000FDC35AE|nr:general stress protein [Mesorhizobium sp. M00.F.Ca.ET.216.01.1.1]TGQ46626.1 hypothetical protein EN859_002865 [Mesorhizobium sp. M00.F.Ca.ET.216.01.1.1]
MQIVSGLFDTHDQAARAVDALEAAGIARDDISVVGPTLDEASTAAASAGAGAAVGAGAGLLAALGAITLPGIGAVVGAGWLASTAIGAAAGSVAGSLIGTLTDAVAGERDARYAEGVILVTARVDETQAEGAQAILAGSVRATPSFVEAA